MRTTAAAEPATRVQNFGAALGSHRVRLESSGAAPSQLAAWQSRNIYRTIPHVITQLRATGVLANFVRVVTQPSGAYSGRFPFVDTDLYKTLEGVSAELCDEHRDPAQRSKLAEFVEEAISAICAAQQPDGYVGTFLSGSDAPRAPWSSPAVDHELYNLGHLIQAAIAVRRDTGNGRLLDCATRFAELALRKFGPEGDTRYTDGHPGVEMALVELARETGRTDFLDFAASLIERRGHGYFSGGDFDADYYQDAVPFSAATAPVGHAVRWCYLAAGATDVAIERGDRDEVDRLHRLWQRMVNTKSYITGGIGSRHSGEDFGDAYELPAERAYSETCAAIAAMQWGWRLLGATGDVRIADHLDRILYNAFAAGISENGTRFFYDNPLQRRADHPLPAGRSLVEPLRNSWFACACCPPNVVRWMSRLHERVACATPETLTIIALTSARVASEPLDVRIESGAPWSGGVRVHVERATSARTALRLRIPAWAVAPSGTLNGERIPDAERAGWLVIEREFRSGDVLEIDWRHEPELFGARSTIDGAAGRAAVVRGPVVYCLEQADLGFGADAPQVDDFVITGVAAHPTASPDIALRASGHTARARSDDPYLPLAHLTEERGTDIDVSVIPYARWANRAPGAMRVWVRRELLSIGELTERGNKQ